MTFRPTSAGLSSLEGKYMSAQIFKPQANGIFKIVPLIIALVAAGVVLALVGIDESPYITEVGVAKNQPVPFSHKHHVGELKIDCRYCHATVEKVAYAGYPATETCMSCHSQVWTNSPLLEPVRDSYVTGEPIAWNKIYELPDFVYFNHSIHVNKGVGCSTCHGRVDEMHLLAKNQPLYMGWCLDCHRNPEQYVRPQDQVFNMEWQPTANQAAEGARLVAEYHIRKEQLTNCYICHR
ncbi:MAG: cytochrome c family protein [Chloroflexaceae bacterium]|nr:cytochrome c family protein [Chloroflexaceae bacterium]